MPAASSERLFSVAACQRPRPSDFLASLRASGFARATFWRRCVPAAPSSNFLVSLRASGLVKRLFSVAACQRPRQATFWRRCVPAASSCGILASLSTQRLRHAAFWRHFRPSGLVMRHFGVAACQRPRHATFWRRCVPAAPSCDILVSLSTQILLPSDIATSEQNART